MDFAKWSYKAIATCDNIPHLGVVTFVGMSFHFHKVPIIISTNTMTLKSY